MQKIIVIVGATGTKKTQLALKLAQLFDAEIINADAFQVYQELNIGVNKPTIQEQTLIKHHLLSYISIHDEFDLKVYQDHCVKCIKTIANHNKNVILCGGSNLYIDAVIKGFNLDKSAGREHVHYFDDWSYDDIYNYVYTRDQAAALKINYNNKKRIIRAAQIMHTTNQSKTNIEQETQRYVYDCFIIETIMDRQLLYQAINARVIDMLSKGWVDEVKLLLQQLPQNQHLKAFAAIGYQHIVHALSTNTEIPITLIQQTTRQLAKKQMTWNKNKYQQLHQFDVKNSDFEQLKMQLSAFLKN